MKKTASFPALLLLLLGSFCGTSSQAQLFKQLLNTVKNTASNRANDKAGQSTNQVLDKADGATQIKAKTGGSGSSGTSPGSATAAGGSTGKGSAMGGDSSSAGNTMKALNLLVGGGGVSAADSAAAIKSFRTASGGPGLFYQYETVTTSKRGTGKDTSTSCLANNGEGRKEMRINMPGAMSGKIINIGNVNRLQYSVLLDPADKSYSLNVIDTALINSGAGETYKVTKVGNETVQGYPCVHSKLTSTLGSGLFKSTTVMDIWTSTAVTGYALFNKMASVQNVKPKMMEALNNAGAGGFLVKMVAGDKNYSMTMLLIKAEERSFPASLFMIPAGYKESQETMMSRMMSGAKKN